MLQLSRNHESAMPVAQSSVPDRRKLVCQIFLIQQIIIRYPKIIGDHYMTLVNFYNQPPSQEQAASDLYHEELVVLSCQKTVARTLVERVEGSVDFEIRMEHENTILKWDGADYFVLFRHSFDYSEAKKKLRPVALAWADAGFPDQVKRI
jgi:hypothetical protein